jgi:hypothetical protein
MVRIVVSSVFLLLLAVCALQFMGVAYSGDCLRQGSAGPHAQDPVPGTPDGQTETDYGEGEFEELAFGQPAAFHADHLAGHRIVESASCPQRDFASDLFRPPTRS